jgi:hypothetical protein
VQDVINIARSTSITENACHFNTRFSKFFWKFVKVDVDTAVVVKIVVDITDAVVVLVVVVVVVFLSITIRIGNATRITATLVNVILSCWTKMFRRVERKMRKKVQGAIVDVGRNGGITAVGEDVDIVVAGIGTSTGTRAP